LLLLDDFLPNEKSLRFRFLAASPSDEEEAVDWLSSLTADSLVSAIELYLLTASMRVAVEGKEDPMDSR
jgi:hypothetical protein